MSARHSSDDVLAWFAMCYGAWRALEVFAPEKFAEFERWDMERPNGVGTCDWPEFERILDRLSPWQQLDETVTPKRKPISGGLRKRVFERDAYRCQRCGSWEGLEVDHIHPVSAGGTNDFDNLQTLCGTCNRSKGARV